MKKGDIVINPYVSEFLNNADNPLYATIFIKKKRNKNILCLTRNLEIVEFVSPCDDWEIIGNIDIPVEFRKKFGYIKTTPKGEMKNEIKKMPLLR